MKKAWSEWVLPAVALIMFGVMIGIGISGFILGYAGAEGSDGFIHECWVLCQPESGVYVRRRPGTQSEAVAIVSCGTSLRTYQEERGTFMKIVELPAEETEGWICQRYIVWTEPEEVNQERAIVAEGRVAARKWIEGPVARWIQPGETVTVYWMSSEWAVTDRGYIRSDYIE